MSRLRNRAGQIPVILADRREELLKLKDKLAYLVASNGIFELLRCPAFNLLHPTSSQHSEHIEGLLELEAAFRFKLPLLPLESFATILAFFFYWRQQSKEVEAILDFHLPSQSYQVVIPHQTVSATGIIYEAPPTDRDCIRVFYLHLHPGGYAHLSTTDWNDTRYREAIYGIVRFPDSFPLIQFFAVSHSGGLAVPTQHLVAHTGNGDFPIQWLEQVTAMDDAEFDQHFRASEPDSVEAQPEFGPEPPLGPELVAGH